MKKYHVPATPYERLLNDNRVTDECKMELRQTFSALDPVHLLSRISEALYTDGAQYLAEHGGSQCLLDEIALIQPYEKNVAAEQFQVWTLTLHSDQTSTLTCGDGNGNTPSSVKKSSTPVSRSLRSHSTSPTT